MTRVQRQMRRVAMAKAYEKGESVKHVAGRFKVSGRTVYTACTECDVALRQVASACPRKPRLLSVSTLTIIALLQNTNDTGTAIAKQLGVRSQWVYMILGNACAAGIKFLSREKEAEANAM